MTQPIGGPRAERAALASRDLQAAQAAGVGDDAVRAPAHHLPCECCGQAVADPDEDSVVTVTAFKRQGDPPRPPNMPRPELNADFATCPACADRTQTARAVLARFPSLAAKFGPWGAEVKVTSAFTALAVLNRPVPDPAAVDPIVLGSLLTRLATPGALCSWSGAFAPVQTQPPGTVAPYPFAGVSMTTRLALRQAYAAHLADRTALTRPEQRLPPPHVNGSSPGIPVPGACLMCGVGHVVRSASQITSLGGPGSARTQVWTLLTAGSHALGGRQSPVGLSGHACPSCSAAIDAVGSIGPSAMLRAYTEHLRALGRDDEAAHAASATGDGLGLLGWGVLAHAARIRNAPPVPPSETPWQHVRLRQSVPSDFPAAPA